MDETKPNGLVTLPPPRADEGMAEGSASIPVAPRPEYFDWRTFDPAIDVDKSTPMAEELITYAEHLDELLAHEGQYALIKGREVIGVFPERAAAVDEAVDRFGDDPAMVKKIVALEPILFLNNVVP